MICAYSDGITFVALNMSATALLGQLAEEAAELGHAALKLQRVLAGENPTPVTEEEAREALIEEIADVYCCLDAITSKMEISSSTKILPKIWIKADRWASRLRGKCNREEAAT